MEMFFDLVVDFRFSHHISPVALEEYYENPSQIELDTLRFFGNHYCFPEPSRCSLRHESPAVERFY